MALLFTTTMVAAQNPPPPPERGRPLQGHPPPPPEGTLPPPHGMRPPPPPRPHSMQTPMPAPQETQPATTVPADPMATSVVQPEPANTEVESGEARAVSLPAESIAEIQRQPPAQMAETPPASNNEPKIIVLKEPAARWPWLALAASLILFLGWWFSHKKSTQLADETERLARSQRQLKAAHQHLKQHSEHLRELSMHDPLTGTLNRQAFSQDFRKSLDHLAKFSRPMNLVVFDLDHFKSINDKQGHLAGDNALKLVVGIVRQHLVSEDLFSRFGGDEFVIACADQPIQATYALAEKIRTSLEQRAGEMQPPMTGLSLSMGISQANPELGYDADSLFERADKALYAAKNRGRNQVIICDDSLPDLPDKESTRRHI